MTDLRRILPSFPVANFAALIPAIEHHALSTTDLLALHPADIAKQTHLPLLDLKRFIAAIQASLADDLKPKVIPLCWPPREDGHQPELQPNDDDDDASTTKLISTLDSGLDAALGGGVPTGRITEFAGESGAGKTQFLLSLCLAVQLPPPRGLSKQALYISTESGLSTPRLNQMLKTNPVLKLVDFSDQPSLDNIHSTSLPDLESQDHILHFQVPVLLERHDIGLIVLDSVAANYRAEFERQGSLGSNMAARSSDLVKLGALLRDLARRHNIAIVVANQVADRFSSSSSLPSSSYQLAYRHQHPTTQETPLASRSKPGPPAPPLTQASFPGTPTSPPPFSLPDDDSSDPPAPPALLLDHQQRWFTGWGDDPHTSNLKTPSLGLVWTTQIACRIVLFKQPVLGRARSAVPLVAASHDVDEAAPAAAVDAGPRLRHWRRWMKVVFAPHVAASGQAIGSAVEFEITSGGLKSLNRSSQIGGDV